MSFHALLNMSHYRTIVHTHLGLVFFYGGIHHSQNVVAQLCCDLLQHTVHVRKLKLQTSTQ
jgi:hypothetical protein